MSRAFSFELWSKVDISFFFLNGEVDILSGKALNLNYINSLRACLFAIEWIGIEYRVIQLHL